MEVPFGPLLCSVVQHYSLVSILLLLYLELPSSAQGNSKRSLELSSNSSVDEISSFVEHITSTQFHQSDKAALKARNQCANVSLQWAQVARYAFLDKLRQVVQITRTAQDAQILSLKIDSVSTRLKLSVLALQDAFTTAFRRYKIISTLAKEAEIHASAVAMSLDQFKAFLSLRENWAIQERKRAWRLSENLQSTLMDLQRTSEYAKEAQEVMRKLQT